MKSLFIYMAGFVVALVVWGAGAGAGAIYDMDMFLRQPHPFAAGMAPPAAPSRGPAPVTQTAPEVPGPVPPRPVRAAQSSPVMGGKIFSEIRVGALIHDEGPFTHNKEGGFDGNLELLFASPGLLDAVWSPRPHVGLTVNSQGDTSQAYLGLTWEWDFWEDFFAGFSLGGAVHTGKTTTDKVDRKELGCPVLFRESIDLGYRILKGHSLMVHLDHISNAKLCSTNEGLENFGLRYGYLF
ncbi:MAG: acyloxyacyl hydrolase [Rhodospirillales bacterium]